MRHQPQLDGLRGLAILFVLGGHTGVPAFGPASAGIGVTLFFGLSGYLITSLLLAEREATGSVDLRAFYVRRALRLLPALTAMLLVVVALLAIDAWPADPRLTATDYRVAFLGVAAYVGNWVYVAGHPLGVLSHAWSLAVEEQFYIVWPAALLLGLRFGHRRVGQVAVVLALAITPWRIFLALQGQAAHVEVGTDCAADALLLGSAIPLLGLRVPQVMGWVGIGGLALLALILSSTAQWILVLPLVVVLVAYAVGACPEALGWRPLAFVGKISYGLYLWHGLVLWFQLPWPVAIAVSGAVALCSWVVIERPFLALKSRLSARPRARAPAPAAPDLSGVSR